MQRWIEAQNLKGLFPDGNVPASSSNVAHPGSEDAASSPPPAVVASQHEATDSAAGASSEQQQPGRPDAALSPDNSAAGGESQSVAQASIWLKRSAHEVRLTASLTAGHLVSIARYVASSGRRRSLAQDEYNSQLLLGEELHRSNRGDEALRRQIDEVSDRIESIKQGKGSTRQLEAERRGLLIRLAAQADSSAAVSQRREAADRARHAVARQDEQIASRRRQLRPASFAHAVRITIGYSTGVLLLLLLGWSLTWPATDGGPSSSENSVVFADVQPASSAQQINSASGAFGGGAGVNGFSPRPGTPGDKTAISNHVGAPPRDRRGFGGRPAWQNRRGTGGSGLAGVREKQRNALRQMQKQGYLASNRDDEPTAQGDRSRPGHSPQRPTTQADRSRPGDSSRRPTAQAEQSKSNASANGEKTQRGFSSGFSTAGNPKHWQPGQSQDGATVTTNRKTYVVNGLGGLVFVGLDQTLDSIQAGQRLRRDFDRRIAAARERFWREFPDGRNLDEARAEFERLLFVKDYHFLILYMAGGRRAEMAQFIEMTHGKQDGGIDSFAAREFEQWVNAIREELGAYDHSGGQGDDALVMFWRMPELPAAIKKTRHLYDAYALKRDWVEFQRAGHQADFYPSPGDYVIFLIRIGEGSPTYKEAEQKYAEMANVIGEERLLAAAARLREAPKNERGGVVNHEELFTHIAPGRSSLQGEVFRKLLGQQGLVGYAVYLDMESRKSSWTEAIQTLNQWFDAFGRKPVLAAVQRIRKAPKLVKSRVKGQWKGERFIVETIPGTEYTREKDLADWQANGFADQSAWVSLRSLVLDLTPVDQKAAAKLLQPEGAIVVQPVDLQLPENSQFRAPAMAVQAGRLLTYLSHREPDRVDARIFDTSSGNEEQTLTFPIEDPATPLGYIAEDPTIALDGEYAILGVPGAGQNAPDARRGTTRKLRAVGAVYVFDAQTGRQLHTLRPKVRSPRGNDKFGVCVDGEDNVLVVGAVGETYRPEKIHGKPQPKRMTSAVYLFNLPSGKLLHTLRPQNPAEFQAFGTMAAISNGCVIVGVREGQYANSKIAALVYDANSGKRLRKLAGGPGSSPSLKASGNFVTLEELTEAEWTKTFDIQTGEVVAEFREPEPNPKHCVYALHEHIAVVGNAFTGGYGASVRLFDVRTWKELAELRHTGYPEDKFTVQAVDVDGDTCWINTEENLYRVDISRMLAN